MVEQIDTQIIMKVVQSGRQTACRLIIYVSCIRQPFYFGRTHTPGYLILGVTVKFSGT